MVTFDPGPALRVIQAELPDALFAVEDVGRGFFVTEPFPPNEIEGVHTVVEFERLCALPATRVVIRSPDHTEADFHAMVERIGLHEVTYSVGWVAWLDLNPKGVTKASALEDLRLELGVAPDATIAIGDGRNDIEMLRWAGRGVAMGNADEVRAAAADEVTASIDDDGVARVRLGLLGLTPGCGATGWTRRACPMESRAPFEGAWVVRTEPAYPVQGVHVAQSVTFQPGLGCLCCCNGVLQALAWVHTPARRPPRPVRGEEPRRRGGHMQNTRHRFTAAVGALALATTLAACMPEEEEHGGVATDAERRSPKAARTTRSTAT